MILAAGGLQSNEARDAWDRLAEAYWYPLYAFARRKGKNPSDAQDLVQGFFGRLLEKDRLKADPERGRFRNYLLTAFQNFVRNQHAKDTAQKRGGGHTVISFNAEEGEERLSKEPAHEITPEKLYQRAWAATLLERVLDELGRRYHARNKGVFFDEVKGELLEATEDGHAVHSEALNMTPGAYRVALHRLRQGYKKLLREEVAHTLATEDDTEVEAELQELFAALA